MPPAPTAAPRSRSLTMVLLMVLLAVLSGVTSAGLLTVLLVGCGPSEQASPPAPAQTPPETPPETPPGGSTATSSGTPTETSTGPDDPVQYRVEVVATHPHDPAAYTQGLEFHDGRLIESTGLRGQSTLRLVDPRSGQVERSIALAPDLFGEGATVVDDEVWQLTWTSGLAIVSSVDDFSERRRYTYDTPGWGLCHDGTRLIMTDGSATMTFRDPATFEPTGSVVVTDRGEPLDRVNELECVGDVVWANVYQTTRLVAIAPDTGAVVGHADLAQLVPPGFEGDSDNVANGIALDPTTGRFWVTGKRWPVLYEIELVPET